MNAKRRFYLCTVLATLVLTLIACATPTVGPTPTPTRTPKPPTPTPTLTLTPSPTPAFPVTVGCAPDVPSEACAQFQTHIASASEHFTWSEQAEALVQLRTTSSDDGPVGTWTYVVAAPFFTVQDAVSSTHLAQTWRGQPAGAFVGHPLLVTTDTLRTLVTRFGPPGDTHVQTVAEEALLATAEQAGAWAILPFDHLTPRWKALYLDGQLPTSKARYDPATYALNVPLYLHSASRPDALKLLTLAPNALLNRDPNAMTIVAMTGVTAITRGTARLIERTSVTYPAQDVKPWFADADFVHVSNEVSFKPDCSVAPSGTMSFCSHDRYIALLEEIGTNIVELTGNHLEDKGAQWVDHTLEMYRERGWQWYGGGANQTEGEQPLRIEHGPNKIAFLGCNVVGPFADAESGGAARCDVDRMKAQIQQLREEGYAPIVTLQQLEVDQFMPPAEHLRTLRTYAEAGAVIVHGSQAHWVKPMEFHGEAFVHYGPGNFFFDQMWDEAVRKEFVLRYTFYNGELLNIEMKTALLEEYGRPRPMTTAERTAFLTAMFELSRALK
ncbi:MAG: CapA family protein [Anaerolineae bacterium]